MLPLVGAAGILVAITLDVDPIHDIGLFVFEGAWVALGVALLRAERRTLGRRPRPLWSDGATRLQGQNGRLSKRRLPRPG
jgi:hypothetical protein